MAYLQTNTHLENLEVVELADKAVHIKKRLAVIKYGKEDDFKSHPIFNFQFNFNFNSTMYCI